MTTALLTTKLYRPPPRAQSVVRQRLLDRLERGLAHRITLIAAPAGFGKTTLLSQWLETCPHPVAWLALDARDGEPTRFLAYLIAAVQTVAPQFGAGALALLLAPQPPSPTAMMTTLINELAALPQLIMLVLDDYHQIDSPAVDQALSLLLEHQPAQVHLVIATRAEPSLPLARLRARGQLNELRAADLRFMRAEAADLLQRAVGRNLADEIVAALDLRTEGWATGLHLAALALQNRPTDADALRTFTGSQRFVLDYLLQEVLAQQPAPIRQFLLHTAILDRLCGPLCDATLGAPAGTGQAALEAIERANLFLVPLDDHRRWYRYHHLFGTFLREQLLRDATLSAEAIAELHTRASSWYEAEGLELEALYHMAAAGDAQRLAALAERSWQRMDSSFQTAAWCGWVRQLPEEALQSRPELCLQYANALINAGELEAAETRLRDAERGLTSNPEATTGTPPFAELAGQIALARGYLAQASGASTAAAHYATAALASPAAQEPLVRAQAETLLGMAHWNAGNLEAAHQALTAWVAYARQSGNSAFALASGFYLGELRFAQGQLREAARTYRQFLHLLPPDAGIAEQAAPNLHLGLAMVAHEQGDAANAAFHLQQSRAHGGRTALIDWPSRLHIVQARIHMAAGEWSAALDQLDEAERLYVRNPVPIVQPVAALRARVQIAQGNLMAAQAWAVERRLTTTDELSYLREYEQITFARLLLARFAHEGAHDALYAAQDLLARLLPAAQASGRIGSVIELLLLQAIVFEARADLPKALAVLERALVLAEPEGYVRLFIDAGAPAVRLLQVLQPADEQLTAYRQLLLAAAGAPPAADPLVEPLSEREREVLRLIAKGLSNQELAAHLYLSLHTIKVHTRNIYSKLGVNSRTQAVARSRKLGLLD